MPRQEHGIHETTGLSGAEHAKALARAAIDAETLRRHPGGLRL